MEGTLAEIRGFAGNFAPRNWNYCAGQLLSINSNQALFSLLGTTYGGDGRTTFGLPDLRGRAPVGAGHGPGLSNKNLGQRSGIEWNYLTSNQLASHTHTAIVTAGTGPSTFTATVNASSSPTTTDPNGKYPSLDTIGPVYGDTKDVTMAADMVEVSGSAPLPSVLITNTGASSALTNMQPYLAINWVICVQGLFPSRN